ncbi:MAG: hypothetical protein ACYC5X_04045 [Syntrophales bacterium]
MKVVLKRALIAAVLVAICVAVLAATKAYGVWVITGTAVLLFILGLLRREKSPGRTGEDRGDWDEKGNHSSSRKNH